jgi:hypothetical protein
MIDILIQKRATPQIKKKVTFNESHSTERIASIFSLICRRLLQGEKALAMNFGRKSTTSRTS